MYANPNFDECFRRILVKPSFFIRFADGLFKFAEHALQGLEGCLSDPLKRSNSVIDWQIFEIRLNARWSHEFAHNTEE